MNGVPRSNLRLVAGEDDHYVGRLSALREGGPVTGTISLKNIL